MKVLAKKLDSNLSKQMTVDKSHITNFTRKWVECKKVAKVEQSSSQSIKKNNTNSLLLTMLDLVFEESSEFPLNNSQFYNDGLEILLKYKEDS